MRWAEAAAFGGGHLQACSSPPPTQGPKGTAVIVGYAFAFPHLGDALVGSLGVIPLSGRCCWLGGSSRGQMETARNAGCYVPPCQMAGYLFMFGGYKSYPLSSLPLPSWSSKAPLWEARQVPTRDSVSGAAFLSVELRRVQGRSGYGSPMADLRPQPSSL